MGFKERVDLDCDKTTAIGGTNKESGKPNPRSIEGYYVGTKDTPSKKSKNGIAKLHILQTKTGNVGVWGKTNLDQKMVGVAPGVMIRISFDKMVPTPNGDMYKYKVEVDEDNAIEVNLSANSSSDAEESSGSDEYNDNSELSSDEYEDETDPEDDEPLADEVPPARAKAPARAASVPDAARQAKVKQLLGGRKASA